MDPSTVGQRLRIAREAEGFTQKDIALAIGTSVSAISMIESGKRDPRSSTLLRYLEVVGWEVGPRERARSLTLEDAAVQAEQGRQRLERAGIGPSDPEARLERKRRIGVDVSAEERVLASRARPKV